MDPLTHGALGAITGELTLGRQMGSRALLWGALFGLLPDIDVILSLPFDTAHELAWHRGFFHSLLFIGVMAFGLARPLARRWAASAVSPAQAGTLVGFALASHLLIDLFSVYGAQPFDPFSHARISFDNLFIIDPVFTTPLLVGVAIVAFARFRAEAGFHLSKPPQTSPSRASKASFSRKKAPARKAAKKTASRKTAAKKAAGRARKATPSPAGAVPGRAPWWCLGISFCYVGLSFWAKHVAAEGFGQDLARRGVAWTRRMESPTPMNLFLWRGLVERDGEIWLGYRSIFDGGSHPVEWTIFPKGADEAKPYEGEREIQTVEWFSKGWWIARPAAGGVWIADLRFDERRKWDRRGVALHPGFSWTFNATAEGNRLRNLEENDRNAGETLKRMGSRITGDREAWESQNPRLVGSFLALQEYLNIEPAQ